MSDTANTLSLLRKLHDVDAKIFRLEKKLNQYFPRKVAEHEAVLNAVRAKYDAKNRELVDRQKQVDSLELDLKSREAAIEKLNVQLNTVKTNTEYQAFTTKIAEAKADNSRLEEEILEIMDSLEGIRAERSQREADVKKAEEVFRKEKAELDAEAAEYKQELEEVRATRAGALADIPTDALDAYNRILAKGSGSAMAAVRGRICQGCQLEITMHDLTRILNGNELVVCRHCSHILYPEDRQQVSK